jgi:hypothetical protein
MGVLDDLDKPYLEHNEIYLNLEKLDKTPIYIEDKT